MAVCFKHSIKLEVDWVIRSLNERADIISRVIVHDDWSVNGCIFQAINSSWGPHSVDCVASQENAKLPGFHSRFWSPHCEAVDICTTNCEQETCWWVPPLYLVCRLIHHAQCCRAKGTLIVPTWKSDPLLCPDGHHFSLSMSGGLSCFILGCSGLGNVAITLEPLWILTLWSLQCLLIILCPENYRLEFSSCLITCHICGYACHIDTLP